jgi:phage terminase large subunit GpA-like protein
LPGDYDTAGLVEAVREWHYHVDGEERLLPIWRVGIDTGGGQYSEADATMTEAAYLWIRKMRRPGLYGTKGLSRETFHRVRERRIDKMPGDKGAPIPGGLILIEINSDAMKDVMWFHLNIEPKETVDPETGEITIDKTPAGRLTFHNGVETDFFKQILAEERQMQKDGSWEWIRIRKANHWLDATVIAFAMADSEFRGGIRLVRQQPQGEPKKPPTNPMTQRPRGNWVKGW